MSAVATKAISKMGTDVPVAYPPGPFDGGNSRIVELYMAKTPRSRELATEARGLIPSGITHDVRYIEPYGIYVTRAEGSRKWDVDGNEYVDYPGGHGALILGHGHPAVLEAIAGQLPKGMHFGACHELELEWCRLVKEMVPCAEKVRLTNSGTESTLLALRLARAYTGKPKLLRFLGHFHGWHDHVSFGVTNHMDGSPTPGVLPEIAQNVILAPPWDWEETLRILDRHSDEIGTVIIEPTGSTWGQVPVSVEFVRKLREETRRRGMVLIFDEVITGFRCAPGGAQEAMGIVPDLATFAKIMGGGMHGGAVAGRAEILDLLDFRIAKARGVEKVGHQGTFNAMPLSCVAGIATLQLIRDTDVCERATQYGRSLQSALNRVFTEEGVPWVSYGTFGGFHVYLNAAGRDASPEELESGTFDWDTIKGKNSPMLIQKIRLALLVHGVDIQPWPGAPISAVHTAKDCHHTAEAFRQAVRLLREDGDIK